MNNKLITATLPLIIVSSVFASDTNLALSYVKTTGNSETTSFSAKAKTKQILNDISSIDAKLDLIYGENNNEESANKYEIDARYNHIISSNFYGFLGANYLNDKLSDYDYRASIGPGLGYTAFKDEIKELNLRAAIEYSQDKDRATSKTDSYASGKTELEYKHQLTTTVNFNQFFKYKVSFEDSDNYVGTSDTGIAVKMSDTLSLGVSYKYEYTNQAEQKKDTQFLTSLIIDF